MLWDTQKKSKTGSIVVAPAGAYRKAGQPPALVGLTQPQGRKIHLRSCKGQKRPGHQPQSLRSQQETAGSAHRASAHRLAHGSRFVTSAPKDPAPTPRPRSHWLLSGSAPPPLPVSAHTGRPFPSPSSCCAGNLIFHAELLVLAFPLLKLRKSLLRCPQEGEERGQKRLGKFKGKQPGRDRRKNWK